MPKNWVMAPFLYADRYADRLRFDQIWNYDLQNDVISIGWSVGKFASLEELERKYQEQSGLKDWTKSGLSRLKKFWYDIKPEDRIIARAGTKKMLAVGTVTDHPFHDAQMAIEQAGKFDVDHFYFLPVRWEVAEREFPKIKFTRYTLVQWADDKFMELANGHFSLPLDAVSADPWSPANIEFLADELLSPPK